MGAWSGQGENYRIRQAASYSVGVSDRLEKPGYRDSKRAELVVCGLSWGSIKRPDARASSPRSQVAGCRVLRSGSVSLANRRSTSEWRPGGEAGPALRRARGPAIEMLKYWVGPLDHDRIIMFARCRVILPHQGRDEAGGRHAQGALGSSRVRQTAAPARVPS